MKCPKCGYSDEQRWSTELLIAQYTSTQQIILTATSQIIKRYLPDDHKMYWNWFLNTSWGIDKRIVAKACDTFINQFNVKSGRGCKYLMGVVRGELQRAKQINKVYGGLPPVYKINKGENNGKQEK